MSYDARRSSVMSGTVMLGASCQSISPIHSDNMTWYQVETDSGLTFKAQHIIDDANHVHPQLLDAHVEE